MATVSELKTQLATIEQELIPLRAALDAAKIKSSEAEAVLNAVQSQPGRVKLTQLINAKNAAAADPNNAGLQQQYNTLQSQWDAQKADTAPLIAARDAAYAAQTAAAAPVVAKETEAANIELEIAKADPSQASPEAVQYLKENGQYPITQQSDPALSNQTVTTTTVPVSSAPLVASDGTTPATNTTTVENASPADTIDPSSASAVNGSDLASDQAALAAAQKDPSSAEYISEADRASDLASQQIQDQKNPSSAEYVNEADRASDAAAAAAEAARNSGNTTRGLTEAKKNNESQATAQDQANFTKQEDWRVRLSLAPGSNYLYNATPAGILEPLKGTGGVIFPYTPSIQVSYAANYDPTELIHANYKVYQYKNSSVDNITISCDFTAQDTSEANYLLAVIHFFRSVTKMFYGQDNGPKPGTPPPVCFLTGLGAFQFNEHPLAITSFTYSLPTDVDYIRAGQAPTNAGVNKNLKAPSSTPRDPKLSTGGNPAPTVWGATPGVNTSITYVPTRMQIQISAVPMMSRNDVSNNFSLRDYSNGKLLRGIQDVRGGFW